MNATEKQNVCPTAAAAIPRRTTNTKQGGRLCKGSKGFAAINMEINKCNDSRGEILTKRCFWTGVVPLFLLEQLGCNQRAIKAQQQELKMWFSGGNLKCSALLGLNSFLTCKSWKAKATL